jgi:hypothetical protein
MGDLKSGGCMWERVKVLLVNYSKCQLQTTEMLATQMAILIHKKTRKTITNYILILS